MGHSGKRQRKAKNVLACHVCQKPFMSARYDSKTCSAKCRKRLQRQDETYVEPRERNRSVTDKVDKVTLVMDYIRTQPLGKTWYGSYTVGDCVLSLDVSPATVYKAIKALKRLGEIDQFGSYRGRQSISMGEVYDLFKDSDGVPVLLSEKWWTATTKKFNAPIDVIENALYCAERWQFIERVNGGSYGRMYRALNAPGE